MNHYSVAIAGATGYAGGEALRILAAHPNFEVTCVTGHASVGDNLGKHMPHIPSLAHLTVQDTTPKVLNGHDIIILALPHGASGALAAQLDSSAIVIDLGADHRLESENAWQQYYGGQYYQHWTYGMPELVIGSSVNETGIADNTSFPTLTYQRTQLEGTKRIAGPGCNVTAVTLAMQPALLYGLTEHQITADLVVGYSGAGKSLKRTNLLASEAFGSAVPYGVGGTHRHIPEILQNLGFAANATGYTAHDITLGFTPVLAPMSRGILAVVSAPMSAKALDLSDEQIHALWEYTYADQQFIHVLAMGDLPATANVLGSNAAHVQVVPDRISKRLYAFAAIDNLNRGTAGQAVQSLNIALGLPEDQGLTTIGVAP